MTPTSGARRARLRQQWPSPVAKGWRGATAARTARNPPPERTAADLGFGRIVVPEIEAPDMLAFLV
jgi:hypothetical protein